jgi:hypothetical protein
VREALPREVERQVRENQSRRPSRVKNQSKRSSRVKHKGRVGSCREAKQGKEETKLRQDKGDRGTKQESKEIS